MKPVPPPLELRTFRRINQLSNAKLMRLLLEGLLDCRALAAESGIHYLTVLSYVKALYEEGAAYIDHYDMDARGAMRVKIYKLGMGVDAVQPRMSSKERSRRYREARALRTQQAALTGALFTSETQA